MQVERVTARTILTPATGYLSSVCTHSLNPYQGCSFGRSLCGVACYVQHNPWITRGRLWGHFLVAKTNAAELYLAEARPSQRIFLASSTDPFVPQERSLGITQQLLLAMQTSPPAELVLQTHSADVANHLHLLSAISSQIRVHLSIESDRERLPGLPPAAFSVESRLRAAAQVKAAGLFTVATLSPLFPLASPREFFERLQMCVDAVVIDHFIEGDGSRNGQRTRRTALPVAMESLLPGSTSLDYREQVVQWAREFFPGRVGVGSAGFAGNYS